MPPLVFIAQLSPHFSARVEFDIDAYRKGKRFEHCQKTTYTGSPAPEILGLYHAWLTGTVLPEVARNIQKKFSLPIAHIDPETKTPLAQLWTFHPDGSSEQSETLRDSD